MSSTEKSANESPGRSKITKLAEKEAKECSICHARPFTRNTLRKHIGRCHSFSRAKPIELRCLNCNLKFNNHNKLQNHLRECTYKYSNLTFPCTKCNKTFGQKHELNRHVFICQNEYIFCMLCPYKDVSMDNISEHILNKHHLKCTPVEEPDFEQALNWTPYILERLEDYPYKDDNKYDIVIHNPNDRVNGIAPKSSNSKSGKK